MIMCIFVEINTAFRSTALFDDGRVSDGTIIPRTHTLVLKNDILHLAHSKMPMPFFTIALGGRSKYGCLEESQG